MTLPNGILKQLLLVYLFSLTGLSFTCFSQTSFRFEHFTTEHGLSENFIYSIIQDSKGYLWIGTHDGLNRYDGYSFKKYRHNPADTNSLPNNTIQSICEDSRGNIWVATNGGLCKFNTQTNTYTTILRKFDYSGIIQLLQADKEGLLLKTTSGIYYINSESLEQIPVKIFYSGKWVSHFETINHPMTIDHKGEIYNAILDADGFKAWRYNRTNKSFDEYLFIPCKRIVNYWLNSWYYPGRKKNTWIGLQQHGIKEFNAEEKITQKQIEIFRPGKPMTTSLMEDSDSNLWQGTDDAGLYIYKAGNVIPVLLKNDIDRPESISSDQVNIIYQDKNGMIWIGTSKGLNKFNPRQSAFHHLTVSQNNLSSLADDFVLGVRVESAGSLLINYNSLNHLFTRYNNIKNLTTHYSNEKYDYEKWITEITIRNPSLLTDQLKKTAMDSLRKHTSGSEKPNGNAFIDPEKNLWYLAGSEIISLNTGRKLMLNGVIIDAVLYQSEIWIATNGGGLYCFNTRTKQLQNYKTADHSGISSNDLTSIIPEENGNAWVGTKGGGFNYFDRKKNKFIHYTEDDGLCNSSIYCMVKDNNGKIWIGTSNGLSCFDPATKKFRNYSRADGLINSEYNRQSACKLPDGTVFMGGMNGIDYFHPDSLSGNSNPPQVLVTDFKVFNKNIEPGKNLSLNHDENFITLEFAAMDFTNPVANKFMYKLEGVDKDWIRVENRNFTTYAYLKPGSYRFLVKAANSDGVWNDEPAEYTFTILPAWYQTWWFYSLLLITIAGAIYLLFRYRLNQKLKLFAVRQRIHRDLHDDVGATLSSVKAYSELLKDNPDNPVVTELIQQNATEMIEKLEVIAWATNPQHDSFGSLLDKMKKFAYPLCHAKKIELDFSTDSINSNMNMSGEARQNILLIFKEAINNTAKYSAAGHCKVEMGFKNADFFLKITDDGAGMSEAILGSGNGIKNMKARANEMAGIINVEKGKSNGTIVDLRLPYPFRNTKFMG